MPACTSACGALPDMDCAAVQLQFQVAAPAPLPPQHRDAACVVQVPAALQNMTLDGRGGGSLEAVPLNYLHMVTMVVVVVVARMTIKIQWQC